MAPHGLDGSFHRVRRAEEHLADLQKRGIEPLIHHHVQAVSVEFDPKPPHQLLITRAINMPAPMSIPVRVGEICYNLRSALDYLVFRLAILDSGSEQSGTQFPIEDKAKVFAHRVKTGRLMGVNSAHVAAIERLQPYRGCEWSAALRNMSNGDKHREFVTLGSRQAIRVYDPINDPPELYAHFPFPEHRAHHPIHGEMTVKLDISITVCLSDGTPIMETLEKIKAGVAQTLADFYPEFERRKRAAHRATLRLPDFGTLPIARPTSKG